VACVNNGSITIEGCLFDGRLLGASTSKCGGFIGWRGGSANIYNSLFAPAEVTVSNEGSATFARNDVDTHNCYYTTLLNDGKSYVPQYVQASSVWRNGIKAYAVDAAPANLGAAVTGEEITVLTAYENGILFDGKYYVAPAAVTLYDNATNDVAGVSGYVADVTLSGRTLWKDGAWNTLCLPFDVTIAGSVLDGTGVVARTLTEASIEGTTLNLTFGDAVTTLTAGVPYIIKWTKDDEHPTITDPVFSGVTIDATDNSFDNQVSGDERVRFLGTYKSTTFTDEDKSILFLGAENALYYPQPDIDTENPANSKYPTIGAQRAYFKIGEDDAPQQARRLTAFNIDFGDEQTGIVSVSKDSGSEGMAGAWFSLDGVRIDGKPTRKGLYIHNGRKEVVK
jgi:hypothetical protein